MKKVINIETLEVFESLTSAAIKHNVRASVLFNNILFKYKTKGNRFEYFDNWKYWSNKEKEKFTRKNNIFFI